MALARTNVTIPAELLAQVDELAGPGDGARSWRTPSRRASSGSDCDGRWIALKGIYVGTSFEMDDEAAYRWVRDLREDPADVETP